VAVALAASSHPETEMSDPLITLITPCLNAAPHIAEAIGSACQDTPFGVEHLVYDAMSQDATPDILARHAHLTVIRESDAGMYDAINKGMARARGRIIGLLNADDSLPPGSLTAVATAFFADRPPDIVSGSAAIYRDDFSGDPQQVYRGPAALALSPEPLMFGVPVINSRFFSRNLAARIGPLRLDCGVAADREWLLRIARQVPRHAVLDTELYRYRAHSGSATMAGHMAGRQRIWQQHVKIAAMLLAEQNLEQDWHRAAREWLALESTKLCWAALSKGDVGAALTLTAAVFRAAPAWPLALPGGLQARRRHLPAA